MEVRQKRERICRSVFALWSGLIRRRIYVASRSTGRARVWPLAIKGLVCAQKLFVVVCCSRSVWLSCAVGYTSRKERQCRSVCEWEANVQRGDSKNGFRMKRMVLSWLLFSWVLLACCQKFMPRFGASMSCFVLLVYILCVCCLFSKSCITEKRLCTIQLEHFGEQTRASQGRKLENRTTQKSRLLIAFRKFISCVYVVCCPKTAHMKKAIHHPIWAFGGAKKS